MFFRKRSVSTITKALGTMAKSLEDHAGSHEARSIRANLKVFDLVAKAREHDEEASAARRAAGNIRALVA